MRISCCSSRCRIRSRPAPSPAPPIHHRSWRDLPIRSTLAPFGRGGARLAQRMGSSRPTQVQASACAVHESVGGDPAAFRPVPAACPAGASSLPVGCRHSVDAVHRSPGPVQHPAGRLPPVCQRGSTFVSRRFCLVPWHLGVIGGSRWGQSCTPAGRPRTALGRPCTGVGRSGTPPKRAVLRREVSVHHHSPERDVPRTITARRRIDRAQAQVVSCTGANDRCSCASAPCRPLEAAVLRFDVVGKLRRRDGGWWCALQDSNLRPPGS